MDAFVYRIEKGQGAPVDAIIAIIGDPKEDVKAILQMRKKMLR